MPQAESGDDITATCLQPPMELFKGLKKSTVPMSTFMCAIKPFNLLQANCKILQAHFSAQCSKIHH